MTDRPIIFNGPMVRAILDGRKKQTRRTLMRQPDFRGNSDEWKCKDKDVWGWEDENGQHICVLDVHPGFAVGDRLWVREAFYLNDCGHGRRIVYDADDEDVQTHRATIHEKAEKYILPPAWTRPYLKRRPSIHMPRWASRLTLTVTDVRVQRLREISEEDACWEGVDEMDGALDEAEICRLAKQIGCYATDCKAWFATLWNSIYGPSAWDANPWVCAITFTAERRNIDNKTPETDR